LIPAFLPIDFEQQITALPTPENVVTQHYKVKHGDTLFRVAKRFSINPSELKRLNGLRSGTLKTGATLLISQPRAGNAEFASVQNELFGKTRNVVAAQRAVSRYKVRRGDTLSSIARKHGLSIKQLASLNGLRGKTHVRLGQVLKVTGSAGKTQTASRSSGKRSTKRISYAVRKGDTLFSISKRYNVTVEQIRNWNNADHSIRPGQGLVLHVASNERSRQSRL
jgi:membrane-bound lytic murein transglycosylase D